MVRFILTIFIFQPSADDFIQAKGGLRHISGVIHSFSGFPRQTFFLAIKIYPLI